MKRKLFGSVAAVSAAIAMAAPSGASAAETASNPCQHGETVVECAQRIVAGSFKGPCYEGEPAVQCAWRIINTCWNLAGPVIEDVEQACRETGVCA